MIRTPPPAIIIQVLEYNISRKGRCRKAETGCVVHANQKACLGTGTAMKLDVEHITMLAGQVATGAVFLKKITVVMGLALWDQEAMSITTQSHLAGKLETGFVIESDAAYTIMPVGLNAINAKHHENMVVQSNEVD
ncbi:hypothetical protein ACET3Z_009363 [Daucus carota]